MAKTSLVLTVLGADRPGLVEFLANIVAEHDANWLESRMAHLGGHFAGLLRVEVDADRASELTQAIQQASAGKLDTIVYPDDSEAKPAERPALVLDVTGHDRPGIVREITRVLAAAGANLEDLHTEALGAPYTGQPVFHATVKIHLPPDADE
ncbi:MAG: ACT domain-containing protein, partial [Planctomycetota bacterium]